MPKFTNKEEKEKKLEDYIGNDIVSRVTFSMSEKNVSIIFRNDLKIKLKFGNDYRFDSLFLTNSKIQDADLTGVWFDGNEIDTKVIIFIYNIMERKSDSFIFYCESLIYNLWNNKSV